MKFNLKCAASIVFVSLLISACAPSQRMGMVLDPETGLQFGSKVEKNIVIDPGQFENSGIKVRIRNTSGDQNFDLYSFKNSIENSYAKKGFSITNKDYGILLDINVVYSGQASQNMAQQ